MNETTDAAAIFAPIWKRKWLILAVGILVAVATYEYYHRKHPIWASSTQVYLNNGSEEQALLNGGSSRKSALNAPTQTAVINSPLVHETVRQKLRREHTPVARGALRGKAKAKSAEKSPFITIATEAPKPRSAALLANDTAQAYIGLENSNYQQSVQSAIALTRRQLRRVEAALARPPVTGKGKGTSSSSSAGGLSTTATLQSASLSAKINQLESQLAVTSVKQVGPAKATNATLLYPKPKKNAIFGFVIGIVLAAVAAYAMSRFDRRLRSLAAAESALKAPILAALPSVKQPIVRRDGQLAPSKNLSEPLRRLYTTLHLGETTLADRDRPPRVILFLSADPGDGKSTVVADLALVQRDAGERVAVIEADFRRPVQARLLEVDATNGLAEVLGGRLPLEEALQKVGPARWGTNSSVAGAAAGVATMVESRSTGELSVLVSGGSGGNPPALLAGRPMGELLRTVGEDFDYVLIDARSPLEVSDAMPLMHAVDGIVIVARIGHTRQLSAERLVQLLSQTPSAPVLGVVANSAPRKEIEKYGFSSPSPSRGWRQLLSRR